MPKRPHPTVLVLAVSLAGWSGCSASRVGTGAFPQTPAPNQGPLLQLADWERGVSISAPHDDATLEPMRMYLWFYEWNMFDAMSPGEHTAGRFDRFRREFSDDRHALLENDEMTLELRSGRGDVDLELTVHNRSQHDWPEPAAIIPCFNPSRGKETNHQFLGEDTWFVGPDGLEQLIKRELHFNQELGPVLHALSPGREYAFSWKWPTAEPDAVAGILIRESLDRRWISGIAWERFLSVQGHNPWHCMHVAVQVGPLRRGESRTIRGKIYLFPGTRENALPRFQRDFAR
jgi:hypothetical protein